MILLRDTFVEMLGNVRHEFTQIRASDSNSRKFQRFMRQQRGNDDLPFNNVEITFPDGSPGRFSYLYYPTLVEDYGAGKSERELERWAFRQTKAALDRFIETMDTALSRARDAGDCDGPELLEITGAGFDRAIHKLLPRLMSLKGGPGGRQYWGPDRVARGSVQGISGLAAEVRAQQEMASIDNTMIALSLAARHFPALAPARSPPTSSPSTSTLAWIIGPRSAPATSGDTTGRTRTEARSTRACDAPSAWTTRIPTSYR